MTSDERAEMDALAERMEAVLHAGPSTALSHSILVRAQRSERERDALKAENERLRLITEDFCNEVDRTAQWREARGMKPATDTSEFCSAAPSVLINLKRWTRRFREAMKEET